MMYLAQVEKKGFLGKAALRLLAFERTANTWELVTQETVVDSPDVTAFNEGVLVLADISKNNQVGTIRDAKDWVLNLVKTYLNKGITPNFLQQEASRVEEWRQSLTLQSQDLARRTVDVEARRAQLQELEQKLKKERQQLDFLAAKLKKLQDQT